MKAIGEASGAFKPVVSDDIAMFTPGEHQAVRRDRPEQRLRAVDHAHGGGHGQGTAEEAGRRRRRRWKRCSARASWISWTTAAGSCASISPSPPTGSGRSSRSCSARRSRGTPGPRRSASPWRSRGIRWWRRSAGRTSASPTRSTSTGRRTTARKLRVLMSLDPARTNMGVRWINRKDNDFALAWVKPYGKGRVFNTSFGHMASLYSNPQVLQFYLDAIQFATGDLDAPTAPRESRPVRKPCPGTQPAPGTGTRLRLALRRPDARRLGRRPRRSGRCKTAPSPARPRPTRD